MEKRKELTLLVGPLGVRKSIRAVKNWVMKCWHRYLSWVRCKWFAYGPANTTATPSSLVSLKSTLIYPFRSIRWRLVQVALKKRTLNGCLSVCHPLYVNGHFQVKLQFSSSTCSETESFGSWQQVFYRPNALSVTQPTASKHWKYRYTSLTPTSGLTSSFL